MVPTPPNPDNGQTIEKFRPFVQPPSGRKYKFVPQKDITAKELAECCIWLWLALTTSPVIDDLYDSWPLEVQRHFQMKAPSNIILPGPGNMPPMKPGTGP